MIYLQKLSEVVCGCGCVWVGVRGCVGVCLGVCRFERLSGPKSAVNALIWFAVTKEETSVLNKIPLIPHTNFGKWRNITFRGSSNSK